MQRTQQQSGYRHHKQKEQMAFGGRNNKETAQRNSCEHKVETDIGIDKRCEITFKIIVEKVANDKSVNGQSKTHS